MKIRQTVQTVMKEALGNIVKEKRSSRIGLVIILRGIEEEPNKRLAPCKERVTEHADVGEVK